MKFTIKRKDVAGESLEIERGTWTGQVKVIQEGKPLSRLKEKNVPFEIRMKDGSRSKLFVLARWLDPIPKLMLGTEEIRLAEPLRMIDYIFGCFPVLMFLVYGALSTLVGFFLLMGNFRILRTKMQPSIKWAAIYAMDIAAFWIVIAIVKFVITNGK
jgi:hypothetical protein